MGVTVFLNEISRKLTLRGVLETRCKGVLPKNLIMFNNCDIFHNAKRTFALLVAVSVNMTTFQ